jgi:hypothetical protein
MVSRITHLAVLVISVVAVSPAAADQGSNTLPPPGVRSNPAWHTVATADRSRAETEALIEEARQRQRRRRLGLAAVVVVAAVAAVVYRGLVRSDHSNAIRPTRW